MINATKKWIFLKISSVILVPLMIWFLLNLVSFYDKSLKSLFNSMPDLERRDYIVISGKTEKNLEWVGCGGFYNGTFLKPFLEKGYNNILGVDPAKNIAEIANNRSINTLPEFWNSSLAERIFKDFA